VTGEERRAALAAIDAEVRTCTRCRLATGRTHAVPGEGSPDTEVVFVGEGPGQHEDEQGRPFVGAAGSLLTDLLRSIGWRREDVFITNVVKCRPPGNRDPEPDEMAACAPYLARQLAVLDPAVVVTLGRFSLGTFMPGARIGSAHGTTRPAVPATGAHDASAFALYHPAAAFRQASLRDTLFEDMAMLPQVLIDSRARRAARIPAGIAASAGTSPDPAVAADSSRGTEVAPVAEISPAELAAITAQSAADGSAAPDTDQMRLF